MADQHSKLAILNKSLDPPGNYIRKYKIAVEYWGNRDKLSFFFFRDPTVATIEGQIWFLLLLHSLGPYLASEPRPRSVVALPASVKNLKNVNYYRKSEDPKHALLRETDRVACSH